MTTLGPNGSRHLGIAGHIAGYDVLIMGDALAISHKPLLSGRLHRQRRATNAACHLMSTSAPTTLCGAWVDVARDVGAVAAVGAAGRVTQVVRVCLPP